MPKKIIEVKWEAPFEEGGNIYENIVANGIKVGWVCDLGFSVHCNVGGVRNKVFDRLEDGKRWMETCLGVEVVE